MHRLTFAGRITLGSSRACRSRPLAANAPRAPARAARPAGTRTNRTAARESEGGDQNRCNSPAGNTKIFWKCRLGADPRAPREGPNPPHAVDGPAPDTGGSGPDDRPCPAPWPRTAAGLARPATAGPPAGRPHCNTGPADASAGRAAHSLSTNTADAADDAGLEYANISGHAGAGPREVPTPKRSSRGAEDQFRAATPFTRWPRLLHLDSHREPFNRHPLITPWLPWLRENGSLFRRHRQSDTICHTTGNALAGTGQYPTGGEACGTDWTGASAMRLVYEYPYQLARERSFPDSAGYLP